MNTFKTGSIGISIPVGPSQFLTVHGQGRERRPSLTSGTIGFRNPSTAEENHEGHEEHEGSENISFDAVFQFGYVEVHQQTRLDARQFHVSQ